MPSSTSKILGSTKSEPFVYDELPIVSFVSSELMKKEKIQNDKKKKGSSKGDDVENVTLSGLQGVHDLDNGVSLLVAMGYKEEDCRRVSVILYLNYIFGYLGLLIGDLSVSRYFQQ